MRWLAKKFFWSFIFSGVMLMVVQFLPGAKEKQNQAFKILNQVMVSQGQQEGSFDFRHEIDAAQRDVAHLKEKITDQINPQTNEPETVVIEGKVYPKSANNIYVIDGRRVMYKPRKIRDKKRVTASAQNPGTQRTPQSENSDKLLMSPSEMMKKVKEAQQNMKARNQMLQDLSDDI